MLVYPVAGHHATKRRSAGSAWARGTELVQCVVRRCTSLAPERCAGRCCSGDRQEDTGSSPMD